MVSGVRTQFARALYSNVAESPDELNFTEGDVVEIIEKDFEENEGWWKCSLNGVEGLVPANYMEEVTAG